MQEATWEKESSPCSPPETKWCCLEGGDHEGDIAMDTTEGVPQEGEVTAEPVFCKLKLIASKSNRQAWGTEIFCHGTHWMTETGQAGKLIDRLMSQTAKCPDARLSEQKIQKTNQGGQCWTIKHRKTATRKDTVDRSNLTIRHGLARPRTGRLQWDSRDHHKDSWFSSFIKTKKMFTQRVFF